MPRAMFQSARWEGRAWTPRAATAWCSTPARASATGRGNHGPETSGVRGSLAARASSRGEAWARPDERFAAAG
jgi:hypothetical protein